jgi:hypothetical protein
MIDVRYVLVLALGALLTGCGGGGQSLPGVRPIEVAVTGLPSGVNAAVTIRDSAEGPLAR